MKVQVEGTVKGHLVRGKVLMEIGCSFLIHPMSIPAGKALALAHSTGRKKFAVASAEGEVLGLELGAYLGRYTYGLTGLADVRRAAAPSRFLESRQK